MTSMRKMGVRLVLTPFILAIVAAGCQTAQVDVAPESGGVKTIPVVEVHKGEESANFIAEGSVVPNSVIEASVEDGFNGQVIKINADIGDRVTKGQVLAELHSTRSEFALEKAHYGIDEASASYKIALNPHLKEELHEAELAIQSARQGVEVARTKVKLLKRGALPEEFDRIKAELSSNVAREDAAKAELDRAKKLYDQKLLPRVDVERAETSVTVAQNATASSIASLELLKKGTRNEEIEMANAELARAELGLQQSIEAKRILDRGSRTEVIQMARSRVSQASVAEREAADDLRKRFVLAPASGVITSKSLNIGDVIGPRGSHLADNDLLQAQRQTAFQIIDDSSVTFLANVDQSEHQNIGVGQDVQIGIEAIPGSNFVGRIRKVAPLINPDIGQRRGLPSSTNPNTPYTFNVWVELQNPKRLLVPGQTGQAFFQRKAIGIWIPQSALTVFGQGRGSVYAVAGDTVHVKSVVFDITAKNGVRIVSGLEAGEYVVPNNSIPLKDGQKVQMQVIDEKDLNNKAYSKWPLAK